MATPREYTVRESYGRFRVLRYQKGLFSGYIPIDLPTFQTFEEAFDVAKKLSNL